MQPTSPKQSYKTYAPFGVNTRRFCPIGFHPDLDKDGSLNKNKCLLGPGQYNPEKVECLHKKYCIGGSSWKRKTELEEFSKNLGYRNAHILKDRQFWKAQGGPGTYDIDENLFRRKSSSRAENTGLGREKRFQSAVKYEAPPPNIYFRNITKELTMRREQKTTVPPFEWDCFVPRFKDESPVWKKAPNCYNPKDGGSISALLNKVVSKRGPYDCFTGPRDETTIKNHFAPPSFKGPLNWFYSWPNELEIMLKHPLKCHYGKFVKADRFTKKPCTRMMLADISMCYKDPNHPGPGHYFLKTKEDEQEMDKTVQSTCAFSMSVKDARPPLSWNIYPGPGRYSLKSMRCLRKKNASWVFKSRTERKGF